MTLSHDGYVRLTFDAFQQIPLVQLISGLDEDIPAEPAQGASLAEITGYTEWVSNTAPPISIGWDWKLQALHNENSYYHRSSEPRSNLMLTDAKQLDLGSEKTAALLGKAIDGFDWQTGVREFISNRYAP
ncbi:DUF4902 domain-containing protein [Candidatus Methylospira mobilis]|uniref:DUF4902 domain-containing protein n=1 Tax=Candidatus Methylospira mobilis TaxID=1808979 RepID=A0A5Q0BRP5_9GAMM|nr:DUF4902 domain-containing protein [Candidatus Methylospira mobilis]